MKENSVEKNETHIFPHPWSAVVKGFWTKYPNKHMPFVMFDHIVDMEIINSDTLKLTRIMHSKLPMTFFYLYSKEEIIIDFKEKSLDMTTSMIKKSKIFPLGKENCKYISFINKDGKEQTLYKKKMLSSNKITNFLEYFNNNFLKGCQIVEENSKKYESELIN